MGILRDTGNVNNRAVEPTLQRQLWAAAERDEGAGGRQHQAKSTVRKCLAELEIKKKIKNNLVRVFSSVVKLSSHYLESLQSSISTQLNNFCAAALTNFTILKYYINTR